MAETQTAKQQFDELGGADEMDALEQLRFFCSLAMKNQDWLDVEPFFDAVKANMKQMEMCRKCGGVMRPSKAIEQTWTGKPDFIGDTSHVTMSPGGSGKLIDCMKCEQCGWSVTGKGE